MTNDNRSRSTTDMCGILVIDSPPQSKSGTAKSSSSHATSSVEAPVLYSSDGPSQPHVHEPNGIFNRNTFTERTRTDGVSPIGRVELLRQTFERSHSTAMNDAFFQELMDEEGGGGGKRREGGREDDDV